MDTAETRREVDRILDVGLGELTRSGGVSHLASQVVAWRLPEKDGLALREHGLPPARTDGLLSVVGGLQESEEPEDGLDGRRIYLLGTYGSSRLAAVEGSGEVLAIPSASQVHPDLAHLHPAGILPTVANSTVAALVECAWRWDSILLLLADEQARAGQAEVAAWREGRTGEGMPDPYAGYQELCRCVLRRFQEIDSIVEDDAGFWADVIIDIW